MIDPLVWLLLQREEQATIAIAGKDAEIARLKTERDFFEQNLKAMDVVSAAKSAEIESLQAEVADLRAGNRFALEYGHEIEKRDAALQASAGLVTSDIASELDAIVNGVTREWTHFQRVLREAAKIVREAENVFRVQRQFFDGHEDAAPSGSVPGDLLDESVTDEEIREAIGRGRLTPMAHPLDDVGHKTIGPGRIRTRAK